MPLDRAVAQRLFEQAEGLQILGGAPGDEAGAAAAPAEGERQRPEPRRGQPVEVVERQPGEPGPGRHREQAGGAGPQHGRGAAAGVAEQPLQQAVEGGRVEVDPRPGGEVAGCGSALQQRMGLGGDDARGSVGEAFAPQEGGQRVAGIGGAAVQVALAPDEQAQALGEGGGAQGQRDAGGALAEGGETDREGLSGMATVTRRDLTEAVCDEVGLVHGDAAELVDGFIEAIAERLSAGEEVKISSFGSFTVRDKGARMGRNPKTGEPAAILPCRVVVFRPSAKLKERINEMLGDAGEDA